MPGPRDYATTVNRSKNKYAIRTLDPSKYALKVRTRVYM